MIRYVRAFVEMLRLFWGSPGMSLDRVMSEVNAIRCKYGMEAFRP